MKRYNLSEIMRTAHRTYQGYEPWGEVTVGHSCQIQRIAVLGIFHCSLYFTVLRRARGEKAYEA